MDLNCPNCGDSVPGGMTMNMDGVVRCKICCLAIETQKAIEKTRLEADIAVEKIKNETRKAIEKMKQETKSEIVSIKMSLDLLSGKVNEALDSLDNRMLEKLQVELGDVRERMDLLDTSVVSQINFEGFKTPKRKKNLTEREEKGELEETISVKLSDIRHENNKVMKTKICNSPTRNNRKRECSDKVEADNRWCGNNRYSVLEEDNGREEDGKEYDILGNSEVRYMRRRTEKGGKRGIYSTNGAGIENILEHIRNKQLEGNTTVIHGGGDDIKKLETEPMLKTYKNAIKETREQGKLCIVSGILPRRGESPYWSSRAIGINNRLEKYCREMEGVMFVDNWDRFYGNQRLYTADRVHLSRQGTNLLSVIIDEKVEINLNLDKRRRRKNVT